MKQNILPLNTEEGVRRELKSAGLDMFKEVEFEYFDVIGKDLDSITGEINNDTLYRVPLLKIHDFKNFFMGRSEVRTSEHSKRDHVWRYDGVMIKGAKKGLLHSVIDPDNPHKIRFKKYTLAAEMVVANQLSGKFTDTTSIGKTIRLDVVAPIVMIGDYSEDHSLRGSYILEKAFNPLPNVRGELKPEHFPNDSTYEKTRNAYKEFKQRNKERGFRYEPADEERPYADLVSRVKNGGGLRILATDWPNFVKD